MALVTFNGLPIHTYGELPPVGTLAPDFSVTKTDLAEVRLKNYLGNKVILNIFPSLDTSTCATAMHRFNEIAVEDKHILILCISADLPFAQKRFCAVEHLKNVQPVSVFRHPQFAKDYGVLITDGPLVGLLARAVVLLNESGTIVYTEQVKELTREINYSLLKKAIVTENEKI